MIRRHVFYSGRVQGVGFRYTAESHAKRLGLTGWVRNLSDGRVEMIAEGPKAVIEEHAIAVRESLGSNITSEHEQISPSVGQFNGFQIAPSV